MINDGSLRHQMVLPQQQEFYDMWRAKCVGGRLPARSDIDPREIKAQLPMITLTERRAAPDTTAGHRYKFRLAGTGFWRFYNDEIQGRHVDELPIGCRADYWHRVLDMVVDEARPFCGVTKPNTPIGSHMAQFWIRLPLSSDGRNVDTILGYDHICPLESAAQTQVARQKIYA
ncbi:PAS domain-containing protein [uncultured Algimonas sp.]|uniref:PAS domain-containing protein n=1 Tax=uncultured Algimonas sp. TaxID=1547920 RepID=UPI00260F70E4|nr:PAS domain-containing protein [uncultured Algimonas sp.]